MRPLCIVLLYCQCIITPASSFLPIDTHRNTISIRYQTSMQGWLIDVPNSFESDCVLPQISKQHLLSSDASNFFTCKQLTRLIYDTDYFVPDVIPQSSECLDFLLTLSTTSYVESQTVCGDPYLDNALLWMKPELFVHHYSDTISNLLGNNTSTRLDVRILFIKRLDLNFAVHIKTFNIDIRIPSNLETVKQAYVIAENYCISIGLKNIPHGLLYQYSFHNTMTSCNVRCGKGYLRYPWSATSLPSNTSDDINSVSCQPIQTPLTAITGKMSLVVSSQYALSYALGDDFFNELNGLQKTIEYEFTENNASAIMAIKIPNSKFDDDDFDNLIKQITADLPEDDFQVVESSSRRRLLTYHQILQSQFVIISSDTVSSPATLSQRIKRIENEVLANRQGNIIEKVEDVTPKRMYHLPQVEPPRQGISFDIALIIGLSSFGAIVVLLLLAKLCPSKTSST